MGDSNLVLTWWNRLQRWPAGKWLFSRIVCFKAPYFSSIRPSFLELRPGHCTVRVTHRRSVTNHLGTVHAIAMCNMAELAAGTMIETTLPGSHRWIPKSMTVDYLKPAPGDVLASASLELPEPLGDGRDVPVAVQVRCGDTVTLRATIVMWVSRRK